ncbi:MAG: hypothetical protein KKA07_02100 [Bacteroidetes bacterium]|nr:hypothetical protein [Bacteroidota bacterium]MBU1717842.1 hypothetical protein [Bacteroidota bacterium]
MKSILFLVIATTVLFSCGPNAKEANERDAATIQDETSINEADPGDTVNVENEKSEVGTSDEELKEKAKKLIGKIVFNLEDSTLLKLVYGSFYRKDNVCVYNWGSQIWNTEDSVYMKVEKRMGDDSTQIIYLRGEKAITAVMHNHYNETGLIFRKIKNGWKVMDAYLDRHVVDASSDMEILQVYGNMFLVKEESSSVYGGGFLSGNIIFYTASRDRFEKGSSVDFLIESSTIASDACMSGEGEYKKSSCDDCFSSEGNVEYKYNQKFKCFEFNYALTKVKFECELKNPRDYFAVKQKWYMNADTSFLAEGNILDQNCGEIIGKVKLSENEIFQALKIKNGDQ